MRFCELPWYVAINKVWQQLASDGQKPGADEWVLPPRVLELYEKVVREMFYWLTEQLSAAQPSHNISIDRANQLIFLGTAGSSPYFSLLILPISEVIKAWLNYRKSGEVGSSRIIEVALDRQQYICFYRKYDPRPFTSQKCNHLSKVHVDHLTPISKGGNDNPDNLVLACRFHNSEKGDRSLEEYQTFLQQQVT